MSANDQAGKWVRVGDDLNDTSYVVNPAGTEYEISASRMAQIDRGAATLLNDMLDGLIDLQNENEALRERGAMLEGAAGAETVDLIAAANAAKAEREADAAGYKAVIADLRAEVARLKENNAVLASWVEKRIKDDGKSVELEKLISEELARRRGAK